MAAPVGSLTVPVIEAVSCAKSTVGRQHANAKKQNHARRGFIFNSLELLKHKWKSRTPPRSPAITPHSSQNTLPCNFALAPQPGRELVGKRTLQLEARAIANHTKTVY